MAVAVRFFLITSMLIVCLNGLVAIAQAGKKVAPIIFPSIYYVSPEGSDHNPGSAIMPFKTIQKAADIVEPGDTVIVKDGVYGSNKKKFSLLKLERGGTPDNWITFRSENKWGAVLDGENIVEHGWIFTNTAIYVRVENFEIKGAQWDGFWSLSGAHHIYLFGNHIHEIGKIYTDLPYGLAGVYQSSGTSFHTYDSNVIHDNGRLSEGCSLDHGIYIHGENNSIINNVFYNHQSGWPIHIAGMETGDGDYLTIINNTFATPSPGLGHIIIWGPYSLPSNIKIQNNISSEPKNNSLFVSYCLKIGDQLENILIRNNITTAANICPIGNWGDVTIVDNMTSTDPMLRNPSNNDYLLQPSSPAIDVGNPFNSPDYDHNGNPRPYLGGYDIGAFEFTSLPAP